MKINCNVIVVNEAQSVNLVTLSGRLDGTAPAKAREIIPGWLSETGNMVIDCNKLTFLDSSGLGALVSCLRLALETNGDIRLAEVSSNVQMMLELTRADRIFSIFTTVEEAIRSYSEEK